MGSLDFKAAQMDISSSFAGDIYYELSYMNAL